MSATQLKRRKKYAPTSNDVNKILEEAQNLFSAGKYLEGVDLIEYIVDNFPQYSLDLLANLYDIYQKIEPKDRYTLYQARIFDFNIKPGEKVLDVGSGHKPFPFATHLSDISTTDNSIGRAGVPFKYLDGKPVFEFNVEDIPFDDKEFDFIYCSHVLEHVDNPELACSELQRVGKRGYIETPTKGKDIWLNSGKISQHKWFVEKVNNKLLFIEYTDEDAEGIGSDILMNMHIAPQTKREKAYSALLYLKPHTINTMYYWEDTIECEVIRKKKDFFVSSDLRNPKSVSVQQKITETKKLKFMQVHTFYERYLSYFYSSNPKLKDASFEEQISALLDDGFSGNHIIAPYLEQLGYSSEFIVANNPFSQNAWLKQYGVNLSNEFDWVKQVVIKQIEFYKPDVLYLSDSINFDANFIKQLTYRPKLILGWRAADIPQGVSFDGFDVFLSGFTHIGKLSLQLGAKNFEKFFPGFPVKILEKISDVEKKFDLSFVGSWTEFQHRKRNKLIKKIASYATDSKGEFNPKFYLSGELEKIPAVVKNYLGEPRFGLKMYEGLKEGKMVFDARGEIRNLTNGKDLARNETINMRIFEATGVGSLLLTEYHDNLSEYFEIGKEIVVFENEKDLIDKIKYFSKREDELLEIANNGHQRCITEYSMEKRARVFDEIIRKYLGDNQEKKQKREIPSENMKQRIEELSREIKSGKIDEAFEEIIKLKAKKQPVENLDLLRAFCFIQKGDLISAREAMLEELARFPENKLAQDMLQKLDTTVNMALPDDDDFKHIYSKIKNYTMLSVERLYSLYIHAKEICLNNLQGDFVECGVARGGSSALLAWTIKKFSKVKRNLYSFDTYEGMPEPDEIDKHDGIDANSTGWGTGTCDGGVENLLNLTKELGVEDFITPVKGLFQKTLPKYKNEIKEIALLHMDGDWYDSTKTILENLYDLVTDGGYIQIDDYGYWEGCKKAVDEFAINNNLNFDLRKIDGTGVWLKKEKTKERINAFSNLLNLGCGGNFRKGWINIDIVSNNPDVIAYDLRKGIPLENETVDFIYSSHMLEHFPKKEAEKLLHEAYRVLKKGGIIRIAVPDLEAIAREYLKYLDRAKQDDKTAQKRYEWIILELLDQMTREVSGGEMLKYWAQKEIPAYDYVIERAGMEAENAIQSLRNSNFVPSDYIPDDPCEIGKFRQSGEVHKWMYDEYSLRELLRNVGFQNVERKSAFESNFEEFAKYHLDVTEDGKIRKPDSLFMEAVK